MTWTVHLGLGLDPILFGLLTGVRYNHDPQSHVGWYLAAPSDWWALFHQTAVLRPEKAHVNVVRGSVTCRFMICGADSIRAGRGNNTCIQCTDYSHAHYERRTSYFKRPPLPPLICSLLALVINPLAAHKFEWARRVNDKYDGS
jgi:hypothetical protein